MQGFFTYNLDKTTKKKEIRFSLKGEWEASCARVQAALCLCAASRPQTWAVCNNKTRSCTTTVAVLCSMLPSCGRTARPRRRSKFLQWMTAVKARGRFPNTVDDVISYGKCVFSVVDFFFVVVVRFQWVSQSRRLTSTFWGRSSSVYSKCLFKYLLWFAIDPTTSCTTLETQNLTNCLYKLI